MKKILLFSLCLAGSPLFAADAKPTPNDTPVLDEHSRLVQEFMAERAKLVAAREQVKAKVKKARTDNDPKALKTAQDEAAQLERDFKTRNADLARQIKVKEDEKKPATPARPTGG